MFTIQYPTKNQIYIYTFIFWIISSVLFLICSECYLPLPSRTKVQESIHFSIIFLLSTHSFILNISVVAIELYGPEDGTTSNLQNTVYVTYDFNSIQVIIIPSFCHEMCYMRRGITHSTSSSSLPEEALLSGTVKSYCQAVY